MPSARPLTTIKLRVPQLRVLSVLAEGRPSLTITKIAQRAGLSTISATTWRALNGVRQGSSTGDPRPGLLELGLVLKEDLDIDGAVETIYQITQAGLVAFEEQQKVAEKLPEIRTRAVSINKRYQREEGQANEDPSSE